MTRQKALDAAKKIYAEIGKIRGESVAVNMLPNGGRIGLHGEYLPAHFVSNEKGSLKAGRYLCRKCSGKHVDEHGDLIVRDVWHTAGGWQTSYRIGVVFIGFFTIAAESDSFESALAMIAKKPAPKSTEPVTS